MENLARVPDFLVNFHSAIRFVILQMHLRDDYCHLNKTKV